MFVHIEKFVENDLIQLKCIANLIQIKPFIILSLIMCVWARKVEFFFY